MLTPGDVPCAAYHRAVDRDRPACVPHWSITRATCFALALIMLAGALA